MKVEHKLIISYVGIILITSLLWMYFKKQDQLQYQKQAKIKEGFDINNPFDGLDDIINDGLNKVIDPLKNPVVNFFMDIRDAFDAMTVASNDLNKALDYLFVQGGKDFKDIGQKTVDVAETTFTHLGITLASLGECTAKMLTNLPSCFGFYVCQLIGYTLYYLFIGLPIYLIDLLSGGFLDLQPTMDNIFELLTDLAVNTFGDSILSVNEKCYSCNIIPMPAISATPIINATNKMNYDFNNDIPNNFYKVKIDLNNVGHFLGKAFS